MMNFDKWLAEGELAQEPLTSRERVIVKIAYLAGAHAANEQSIQALARIVQPLNTPLTP